jgi:hypothetical protein
MLLCTITISMSDVEYPPDAQTISQPPIYDPDVAACFDDAAILRRRRRRMDEFWTRILISFIFSLASSSDVAASSIFKVSNCEARVPMEESH